MQLQACARKQLNNRRLIIEEAEFLVTREMGESESDQSRKLALWNAIGWMGHAYSTSGVLTNWITTVIEQTMTTATMMIMIMMTPKISYNKIFYIPVWCCIYCVRMDGRENR
ncbi:hypothetical protein EDD21DRAFT_365761 [Dissophora ornata]|nr:hypothetical protein EDD21DRAFT_365761 [Dissophora ornata]